VTRGRAPLVVFPGIGRCRPADRAADRRLGGESIAEVFRSVGGEIRQSWCGPALARARRAAVGQRAITTFNRNWQNRMGVGGEGYLASPAIVAASALAGYMAPPGELGLRGIRRLYGV
jgi:homoaconitase/3-isopropylmalate dehydratase large subunit